MNPNLLLNIHTYLFICKTVGKSRKVFWSICYIVYTAFARTLASSGRCQIKTSHLYLFILVDANVRDINGIV